MGRELYKTDYYILANRPREKVEALFSQKVFCICLTKASFFAVGRGPSM